MVHTLKALFTVTVVGYGQLGVLVSYVQGTVTKRASREPSNRLQNRFDGSDDLTRTDDFGILRVDNRPEILRTDAELSAINWP